MFSDFIKGKKQYTYPAAVQQGIRLHRMIDSFTDTHAATRELKAFFRADYRLYAGAFADVVYDHFLATDAGSFESPAELEQFAASVYAMLQPYTGLMPERFAAMYPRMQQQDWLSNYRFTEGIRKSFGGVVYRSAWLTESERAFDTFMNNYTAMQQCYAAFFPELKKEAIYQLQQLLKN